MKEIKAVLSAYMLVGRMADYLLTGYSISGDGPEQPGDREVVLEGLRSAERVAKEAIESMAAE